MKSILILIIPLSITIYGYSQDSTCPQKHASQIVLFISPDSVEIDSMKQTLGDDFYVIADDAMYYRANAFEILDLNEIEYEFTTCKKHQFLIEGEYKNFREKEDGPGWYMILWNGNDDPIRTFPISLERHLKYLGVNS